MVFKRSSSFMMYFHTRIVHHNMAFDFFEPLIVIPQKFMQNQFKSGKPFTPVGFGSLREMNSSAFKKRSLFYCKELWRK